MIALALLLLAAEPTVDVEGSAVAVHAERSAAAPSAGDRALAGGAAALGAVAGAVLGSSTALGLGASLAGYNEAARTVPELALPPALAAIGAGAAGAVAGGSPSGWAAGLGALAGAGAATVGLALAMPPRPNEGSAQRNARFAAFVLAPAALGAVVAGAAAALFVEPQADLAPEAPADPEPEVPADLEPEAPADLAPDPVPSDEPIYPPAPPEEPPSAQGA